MATFVQLLGDLQDLYGKPESLDLRSHRANFALMTFYEQASPAERAECNRLEGTGRPDLHHLPELLYASGAVEKTAQALESLRQSIHANVRALARDASDSAARAWLTSVDDLAALVYTPPWLPESAPLLRPDGPWLRHVETLAEAFQVHLSAYHPPALPILLPWPHPQWEYATKRQVVFFPDLDRQAEVVLKDMAALLELSGDASELQAMVEQLAPLVMAHELFHRWRHLAGRLTDDLWHEEWVAERLAVAYLQRYHPTLVDPALLITTRILSGYPNGLPNACQTLLTVIEQHGGNPQSGGAGYGVSLRDAGIIQAAMLSRLLDDAPALEVLIPELLEDPKVHLLVPAAPPTEFPGRTFGKFTMAWARSTPPYGAFDEPTVHPGADAPRCITNIAGLGALGLWSHRPVVSPNKLSGPRARRLPCRAVGLGLPS